jgi:hypothetical protein
VLDDGARLAGLDRVGLHNRERALHIEKLLL